VPERPDRAENQARLERRPARLQTIEREAAPTDLFGKRPEPEDEEEQSGSRGERIMLRPNPG
jgi:hypothetical protein